MDTTLKANYNDIRLNHTLKLISEYFDIEPFVLKAHTKKMEVIEARFFVFYFAHYYYKVPINDIKRFFNFKQHGTILNGLKKVEQFKKCYKKTKIQVDEITEIVKRSDVKKKYTTRQLKINKL